MNREQKEALVEEIHGELDAADAIFAVDYRGISVPQAAELRGKLREADATFKVVKNRLTKLAAEKAGREGLSEFLTGPTALTLVRGDVAQAAKAITTFNDEHEVLTFKGGFMGEDLLDEQNFTAIAKLPSRDVLNGRLAGMVASPLVTLTRGLGSMISGLAIQLQQMAEQELVGGAAAPAAEAEEAKEPEAEATEEPAAEAEATEAEATEEPAAEAEAAEADAGEADAPEAEAAEAEAEEQDGGEEAKSEDSDEADADADADAAEAEDADQE